MPIYLIILLIAAIAVFVGMIIYYFVRGKKKRETRDKTEEMMAENKQMLDMYIIDKKKMPLGESGLPKTVLDQAGNRTLKKKMFVVKAKYGPRIMSLIADREVFEKLPVKSNVRAEVSGIYMTGFVPLRGAKLPEPKSKKKNK